MVIQLAHLVISAHLGYSSEKKVIMFVVPIIKSAQLSFLFAKKVLDFVSNLEKSARLVILACSSERKCSSSKLILKNYHPTYSCFIADKPDRNNLLFKFLVPFFIPKGIKHNCDKCSSQNKTCLSEKLKVLI